MPSPCKGHISHVLTELPHHLPKEVGQQIADIVNSAVGDHNRGCDWRKALFQCTNKVQSCLGGGKEHLLLRCLADVATIMYSRATERCPKMVLRLSLSLWHHFELLREIIQVPKTISLGALYGDYLHRLLHSPCSLQLSACLQLTQKLWSGNRDSQGSSPKPSPVGDRAKLSPPCFFACRPKWSEEMRRAATMWPRTQWGMKRDNCIRSAAPS